MTHQEFLSKSKVVEARYLGDGLYASFNGVCIILSAERKNGIHWVGLESSSIRNLIKYEKVVFDGINKEPSMTEEEFVGK